MAVSRSRTLALLVLALCALAVPLVYRHYGITYDEDVQNEYGQRLLRFYLSGLRDWSFLDYLDLYRYGGLFDLLAALLNRISPLGEYETRHALGGLVGLLGLAGTWQLGRRLGGERTGLWALLLLLLTPAWIGHSFNNPKDAPFATAYVWTLVALVDWLRALPLPGWRRVLVLGALLGVAFGIRVAAVLLLVCMAAAGLLDLLGRGRESGWRALPWRDYVQGLLRLSVGLALAWGLMGLFWPYAVLDLLNPLRALFGFAGYPIPLETLAAGHWYAAAQPPRWYLPAYLLLTLPEVLLASLLCALFFAVRACGHGWALVDRVERRAVVVVTTAALLPLLLFVVMRPTAYNGIRHFLFVVPPLTVLAALGWDLLWQRLRQASRASRQAAAAGMALALVGQANLIVRLHPHEYIYFNALAGGVHGADNRWELDYWGNALPEAVHLLDRFLRSEPIRRSPPGPYKIAVCGKRLSAEYFFTPRMQYEEKWPSADFLIALTHDDCHRELLNPVLFSVSRFGTRLAVVFDLRDHHLRPTPPDLLDDPEPPLTDSETPPPEPADEPTAETSAEPVAPVGDPEPVAPDPPVSQ